MTRSRRVSYALLCLALVLSLAAPGRTASKTSTQSAQQARVARPAGRDNNKRVDIVSLDSKLVGETLPYIVVLPLEYDQRAAVAKRYPVLYLLHGLGGHYNNWTAKTKLADYAAQYQMIIVTPEGNDGWYTDSATVPKNKYETYFIEELIPDVQRRYRTVETRSARGIAGLSMGGYGALKFGVKYPQQFVFVASMSGALDAASWTEADLKGLAFIFRSLQSVYGEPNTETRAANDLKKLYGSVAPSQITSLPFVYLDCGTEDVLLSTNRSFAEVLRGKKIPYEYRELPGTHNWKYWDAQVQEVLRMANTRFTR